MADDIKLEINGRGIIDNNVEKEDLGLGASPDSNLVHQTLMTWQPLMHLAGFGGSRDI